MDGLRIFKNEKFGAIRWVKVNNKDYAVWIVISMGEAIRIYNNGEILNVVWNGKQTAFYYKNIQLAK